MYVINLAEDTAKMRDVVEHTKQMAKLDLIRIEAFRGRDMPDFLCHLLTKNDWSHQNKGTLGCFISHTIAWQAIAERHESFSLVIEDDAHIDNYDVLSQFSPPPDADFIFCNQRTTYPSDHEGWSLRPVEPIIDHIIQNRSAIGTDSYLLTPQGARKLLSFFKKDYLFSHVDLRLMAYCLDAEFRLSDDKYVGAAKTITDLRRTYSKEHKLNAYSLSPFVTRHTAVGPTSSRTIEDAMGREISRISAVVSSNDQRNL